MYIIRFDTLKLELQYLELLLRLIMQLVILFQKWEKLFWMNEWNMKLWVELNGCISLC